MGTTPMAKGATVRSGGAKARSSVGVSVSCASVLGSDMSRPRKVLDTALRHGILIGARLQVIYQTIKSFVFL